MSMFHELMMRKKEEIMYATIKGTLTENDGVFSGFSASNYLALQQNFAPEGSWEVCVKIKTGTTIVNPVRYFFGCWGIGNIVIGTTTGTYFKAFISTNNGSSYNVTLTTSSAVSTETVYYVKLGFTGTKYYLEQSTDGVNFVGRVEYSSTAKISSFPVNFGKVYDNEHIWNGDIDLSNSYIKLGSTKYNLQAVVGYTVVGSPTITDGVVTDFSASNYLQLPTINTLPNNVEFGVAFTTNTVKGVRLLGTSGTASIMSSLSISGTSKITFHLANSSKSFVVTSSVSYITGQKYYVEGYQKGTILGIKVSIDNVNWVTTEIEIDEGFTTTLPSVLYLGINKNSNSYLEGSLDLNYTYIKLDNKLWFNGQQA